MVRNREEIRLECESAMGTYAALSRNCGDEWSDNDGYEPTARDQRRATGPE